jgi:hypothetical protein
LRAPFAQREAGEQARYESETAKAGAAEGAAGFRVSGGFCVGHEEDGKREFPAGVFDELGRHEKFSQGYGRQSKALF